MDITIRERDGKLSLYFVEPGAGFSGTRENIGEDQIAEHLLEFLCWCQDETVRVKFEGDVSKLLNIEPENNGDTFIHIKGFPFLEARLLIDDFEMDAKEFSSPGELMEYVVKEVAKRSGDFVKVRLEPEAASLIGGA